MATVALCAGTAFADWVPDQPVLLGLALGLIIPAVFLRQPRVVLAGVALVAGQVGAWRMQDAEANLTSLSGQVAQQIGPRQIRGLVADDPVNRGRTTSLRLSEVLVQTGDNWQLLGSGALLSVPSWPEHEYGEYLQVRGRLQALNGGGAVEALRRQGVLASMSYPKVSYLANPQANAILIGISRFRQRLGRTIDETLPEPAASTLKATILGLRSALPKDEQQALVDTGTVHLVAISGFKLSLLAATLQALGLWLLRRTTARAWGRLAISVLVLTAIAGYTLLTGASPSAVRAAVMAGVVVLAALAGRPRDQLTALALAVFVIVLVRPFELQDGGFELSSLSVLGIALLAEPLISRIAGWTLVLPEPGRTVGAGLGQAAAVSLAATAFDLPVLAGSFHIVSLVSPLANLLGMPLLGPIMVFGGLGAMLGSVVPLAGALLLWPAWAFITLLDGIVRTSAALPYAALPMPELAPSIVVVYYSLLLGAVWCLRKEQRSQWFKLTVWGRRLTWAAIGSSVVVIGCVSAISSQPPSSLRATFLAVPGQATLIQAPNGTKVLIDGGSDGQLLLRQLGSILPPWDRSIDAVLLTSANAEHAAGLAELFGRDHIGTFVPPDGAQSSATLSRLIQRVAPTAVDQIGLRDRTLLTREPGGWRLLSGADSVLLTPTGADVRLTTGSWVIVPMLRGQPIPDGDEVLSLVETGSVSVTFNAPT